MHTTTLWTVGEFGTADNHVALWAAEAQFCDGSRPVGQQPLQICRVGPCAGDHLSAVERSDIGLVVVDDFVDDGGIDDALLRQQRLERFDSCRDRVGHADSK